MGYEVDFLSVGESNGDAICIRHGNLGEFTIHITDGGYKDTGQKIIEHISKYYGNPSCIENVVLSHADNDHVTGLLDVVRHYDVGALWMNRPWLYASEIVDKFHGNYTIDGLMKEIRASYPLLVELESIAEEKNIPVREAFSYTQIGAFTVLAPKRETYLSLIPEFNRTPDSYSRPQKGVMGKIVDLAKAALRYLETWGEEALQENPDPTSASNESCVIQLGSFDGKTVLLTADAGPSALREAAGVAAELGKLLPPSFVQVPHHGSRRNVTPSVLDMWLGPPLPSENSAGRGTAFCSVGVNKPQYPRLRVANAFRRRGYPVYKPTGSWVNHSHEMPPREGMVTATSIPFTAEYEE